MDVKEYTQLYTVAKRLIHEIFFESSFAYNNYSSHDENIIIEKNIIRKTFLIDELFNVLLELFNAPKIKNINMENYTYQDIFYKNSNSIINSICNLSCNEISFYKYHTYSLYIILCDAIKNMKEKEYFLGTSLWFFDKFYLDILTLLTMYNDNIAVKKFNGNDISSGSKIFKSTTRKNIDTLHGIRHMLYKGTASDAPSTDLPNIAIFALRNYIEFWLRDNFNAYALRNDPISVSKIFSSLKNNESEIENDNIANKFKNIIKHIDTLSNINTWTNRYVHSNYQTFFWMPHIVLKYLLFVTAEARKAYLELSGTHSLFPPIIPHQASVYQKICDEIHMANN